MGNNDHLKDVKQGDTFRKTEIKAEIKEESEEITGEYCVCVFFFQNF